MNFFSNLVIVASLDLACDPSSNCLLVLIVCSL